MARRRRARPRGAGVHRGRRGARARRRDGVVGDRRARPSMRRASVPSRLRSRPWSRPPGRSVAGDDQQMPPTNFFRAASPTPTTTTRMATSSPAAPSVRARPRPGCVSGTVLRWHYRSRHEELVAFSNAAFYGGRSITAPRADARSGSTLEGLRWVPVDRAVAESTNGSRPRASRPSLRGAVRKGSGAERRDVAFNRDQAGLILGCSIARCDDPAVSARDASATGLGAGRRAAVRSQSRNVQGDERDVIVLSLGYGPMEPGGRVRASFGPHRQPAAKSAQRRDDPRPARARGDHVSSSPTASIRQHEARRAEAPQDLSRVRAREPEGTSRRPSASSGRGGARRG